jgi:hypothetical protein
MFALNAVVETQFVTLLPPAAAARNPASAAQPDDFALCGPAAYRLGAAVDPSAGADTDDRTAGVGGSAPVTPMSIVTPSESQFGQTISRCPTCCVAVWSYYSGAGSAMRFIRVGTLDRPWTVRPDVHIYVGSARPEALPMIEADTVPHFDKFYPSLEEVWRPDSLARREAVKQQVDQWRSSGRQWAKEPIHW